MNSISYSGKVTIDFYKGKQKYRTIVQHNEGTSELFRYMANCMVGNYNQDAMPRYIHTFYCSDTDNAKRDVTKRSLLWTNSTCAMNVPFSTVQVREGTRGTSVEKEYISEFSFMIPYSQLEKVAGNMVANVIGLYNTQAFGESVTPLAYIILGEGNEISLESNTSNIVIT